MKESLLDNNLAVALCLLIAQQRHSVIYKEHESIHIKLAGQLYDQVCYINCMLTYFDFFYFNTLFCTYSAKIL